MSAGHFIVDPILDPEIMNCDVATKRTICRVGSYVSTVSNMTNYGSAARN
jgi:hypothetical protein